MRHSRTAVIKQPSIGEGSVQLRRAGEHQSAASNHTKIPSHVSSLPLQDIAPNIEKACLQAYEEGVAAGLLQAGLHLEDKTVQLEAQEKLLAQQRHEIGMAMDELHSQNAQLEKARDEVARISALLGVVKQELQAARVQMMASAEDELVLLGHELAHHVFEQSVISEASLAAWVRKAIANAGNASSLKVRLHPSDIEWIDQTELRSTIASNLKWVSDPAVCLGGCVIQSDASGLDARLELQLKTFSERLLDIRNSRHEQSSVQHQSVR
ncbi:FliH/SctL family protein [Acidovorax facilis]|uniref:FliH/SctL family protein n=1 Tax=Acidovorax facilis TaxID=12917 RepID=UPI003CEB46D0